MYVFVFIIILFLVLVEQSSLRTRFKNISVLIVFLLLTIQDGCRWETGTDWNPYYNFFINPHKNNYLFEIGFIKLAEFFYWISKEYTIFLLAQALIVNYLITNTIYKFTNYPVLTMFVYYCLYTPSMGMSRQFLAIAICIFSIRYLLNFNIYKFLFCVFLASLFHKSAIIFIIVLLLRKQFDISFIIIVSLSAIAFSLSGIVRHIPPELILIIDGGEEGHLTHYFESGYGQNETSITFILLSIIRRSIFIGICIWKYHILNEKIKWFTILFNIYFLSYFIYIVFSGSPLQIFVSRLNLYFYFAESFIISYILLTFKNGSRVIYLSLVTIYCAIFLIKSFNTYNRPGVDNIFLPYKGIFINTDYKRTMW